MQTGARRATSATGAKTGKGKNGEVIVEKVMTSDSFLSREIKKAPLIEHDGSLVADISHIPNDLKITIQGAREHNLKNVDLAIPRNRMVVFTGLSGSGKSSLAFDTLFAEGQRRYVESLSAYARQFLGQMDKPDVDFIEGLSPAVSIDQKTTNRNPRSTVGTITEIYDYLRLLFARTGIPHCPECGEPVASQTPQQIVDTLLGYPERTRFQILAPVVKGRKGEFVDMIELLRSDGYARALIDGEMTQLSDDIKLTKQKKHTIEVVVDRLVVKDGIRQRLTDSVETALKLANGSIVIDFVDEEEGSPVRRQPFSEHRSCPNGHTLELDEVEPRTFSFNAPYGACPACTGLGFKLEIDPDSSSPTGQVTGRRRHRTVERHQDDLPVLRPHPRRSGQGNGLLHEDPLEGPAGRRQARHPLRPRLQGQRLLPQSLGTPARILHRLRRRDPHAHATPRRNRFAVHARILRVVHARSALPGLPRTPSEAPKCSLSLWTENPSSTCATCPSYANSPGSTA